MVKKIGIFVTLIFRIFACFSIFSLEGKEEPIRKFLGLDEMESSLDLSTNQEREAGVFNERVMRSRRSPYPGFDDHPYLTKKMRLLMRPYLLPLHHPVKKILDRICCSSRVILNSQTFVGSGFHVLHHQRVSKIRVASHPDLVGYLVKVYLDEETSKLSGKPGWLRLTNRCEGARNIRELIKRKRLKHFTVPKKWLYFPPIEHLPAGYTRKTMQPAFLVVTDMNITSLDGSFDAWKNKVTTKHLDELYCILTHGFASAYLPFNVPYCKNGKFACVDTENPKREVKFELARPYLSPEMLAYWDQLVESRCPKQDRD